MILVDRWMMNRWMMNRWMDGWMDGWMDQWRDKDRLMLISIPEERNLLFYIHALIKETFLRLLLL